MMQIKDTVYCVPFDVIKELPLPDEVKTVTMLADKLMMLTMEQSRKQILRDSVKNGIITWWESLFRYRHKRYLEILTTKAMLKEKMAMRLGSTMPIKKIENIKNVVIVTKDEVLLKDKVKLHKRFKIDIINYADAKKVLVKMHKETCTHCGQCKDKKTPNYIG